VGGGRDGAKKKKKRHHPLQRGGGKPSIQGKSRDITKGGEKVTTIFFLSEGRTVVSPPRGRVWRNREKKGGNLPPLLGVECSPVRWKKKKEGGKFNLEKEKVGGGEKKLLFQEGHSWGGKRGHPVKALEERVNLVRRLIYEKKKRETYAHYNPKGKRPRKKKGRGGSLSSKEKKGKKKINIPWGKGVGGQAGGGEKREKKKGFTLKAKRVGEVTHTKRKKIPGKKRGGKAPFFPGGKKKKKG